MEHLEADMSGAYLAEITIAFCLFVLIFIYIFVCTRPSLQCARSLVVACGIQFPYQGPIWGPLLWEHGILATGPPGKS